MGPHEAEVTCCPGCKRIVEARDYFTTLVGSVLPSIRCRCGYRGLPIAMSRSDHKRWLEAD